MTKLTPASPGLETLKRELELLYLRRTALDRLIHSLEQYSQIAQAAQTEGLKKLSRGATAARQWT